MCLMCIEIFKGRMTIKEARTALTELVATAKNEVDLEHYKDLESADDEELQTIIKRNQVSEDLP